MRESRGIPIELTSTVHSPGLLRRWLSNSGFIAAFLLTLGVDIALVYLTYRAVTAIF